MQENRKLVTFGEAMLRWTPISPPNGKSIEPSGVCTYMRSVGGDELNVCVALSLLGRSTKWLSVLPKSPLGEFIIDCANHANVDVKGVEWEIGTQAEVGSFFLIPEEKRVQYQRHYSSWARQSLNLFDWKTIFQNESSNPKSELWYHCTGISPLTSDTACANWKISVETALALEIPVSLDLNHRKALGSLEKLYGIVKEYITKLHIFVLSIDSLKGIAEIEGLLDSSRRTETSEDLLSDEANSLWPNLMLQLYNKYKYPKIACCFKVRNKENVQRRWTVIVDKNGVHTTFNSPVYHKPKDECGGGSAWMSGYLDAIFEKGREVETIFAARRGDLLAALCQEVVGDHSTTTRSELQAAEMKFQGKIACINVDLTASPEQAIASTLAKIKKAKVIAILRAKNPALTIQRGVELAELGCKALEVTMDSEEAHYVIKELIARIPQEKCIIGVGTVTDSSQIEQLARIGVKFAISPINPQGFTEACHSKGILAIPAAFTPQEIWNAKLQGAQAIKLFPAQLSSPAVLKDIRSVGQFKDVHFIPSGGISSLESVQSWIQEGGAVAVGMGRKLTGGDISIKQEDTSFQSAHSEWLTYGREKARQIFEQLNSS